MFYNARLFVSAPLVFLLENTRYCSEVQQTLQI